MVTASTPGSASACSSELQAFGTSRRPARRCRLLLVLADEREHVEAGRAQRRHVDARAETGTDDRDTRH